MAYTDLCGSKLGAKLGSSLQESAAPSSLLSSRSFASKQMMKMGWKGEGSGLGKHGSGITSHIQVTKRGEELSGLGREREIIRQIGNTWWSSMTCDTLLRLQKNDNTTTAAKVYSEDDLFRATGGARFGVRARKCRAASASNSKPNETSKHSIRRDEEPVTTKRAEWNGLGEAHVLLENNAPHRISSEEEKGSNDTNKRRKRKGVDENEAKVSLEKDCCTPSHEDTKSTKNEKKQHKERVLEKDSLAKDKKVKKRRTEKELESRMVDRMLEGGERLKKSQKTDLALDTHRAANDKRKRGRGHVTRV